MAFSSSSYFAGVATAFVAVAVGFAGGAMVTTSAVQSPNRLERVTSSAPLPPSASSAAPERPDGVSSQPDVTSAQDAVTPSPPATAPSPAADSQPASAKPAVNSGTTAKTDAAATNIQSAPAPSAKRESAASSKNERANARSNDSRRGTYRGRAEDRKFVERKRQQNLDEATNIVRQMPHDSAADQVIVEREDQPRLVERAPRSGFFGIEDGPPRLRGDAPARFGFFGND